MVFSTMLTTKRKPATVGEILCIKAADVENDPSARKLFNPVRSRLRTGMSLLKFTSPVTAKHHNGGAPASLQELYGVTMTRRFGEIVDRLLAWKSGETSAGCGTQPHRSTSGIDNGLRLYAVMCGDKLEQNNRTYVEPQSSGGVCVTGRLSTR
jgi:hypothetical protein